MKRKIAHDFKIVSSKCAVDVSFHMMAINCRLFRRNPCPENRYETYVPASEDVMRAFVDCVYSLVIDPEAIKSRVTADNIHYLMLLAEELECAALADVIEEIKQEKVKTDIEQLERAIKAQEGEVCGQIERVLASDVDESLKHLRDIPVSRIPLPYLARIIEKSIEANQGEHIDRLLCDFILAKIDNEEDRGVCALVNFLHIDRLSWGQIERLFSNKKLEGWLCHDFPVRFLNEMLVAVNAREKDSMSQLQARQAQFEAEMTQKIAALQAENEEYKRRLGEDMEQKKREIEARVAEAEGQVRGFTDSLSQSSASVGEVTSALKGQIESAQSDISSLKSSVSSAQSSISSLEDRVDSCVRCGHKGGCTLFECHKCDATIYLHSLPADARYLPS